MEELLKVPDDVLLKESQKEVGELKSYVDELEYVNNCLKKKVSQLQDKDTKKRVQEQLMYQELHNKNINLKLENQRLLEKNKELVRKYGIKQNNPRS